MTRRLLIQAGASSPFRVASSSAGDAGAVDAFSTIFDGNQMPLRFSSTGYVTVVGLGYTSPQPCGVTQGSIPVYSTPAGQYPVFAVQEYRQVAPNPSYGWAVSKGPGFSGIGGGLNAGYFYGLCFNKQANIPESGGGSHLGPIPFAYVCYAIFKNYG